MANPKGHVKTLIPYTTDRAEACTAQIALRIPPSLKAKLKNIDNWQEQTRKYLEKIAERDSA